MDKRAAGGDESSLATGPAESITARRRVVRWAIIGTVVSTVLTLVGGSPAYGSKVPKPQKPGAPTAVQAVGINTAIGITWTAPATTGSSPITSYTVTAEPHGETCTTAAALSCTITGLVNGRRYKLKVRATNAIGASRPSIAVLATPSTAQACSYPGPDANLQGCDLDGADLAGANLADANLTGANLTDATLNDANLTDAHLSIADLAGALLTGAEMSGLSSGGVTGTPAGLPMNWILVRRYGYLVGPGVQLASAYFTGNDLVGADMAGDQLAGADLSGCDLSGADLSDANLFGVTTGGVTGIPAGLPTGWMLIAGYLIGNSANLTDASLAGADLTGTDLTNSDLAGADLTGATLTGVSSGSISGTPAGLPVDWVIVDGYLIGPGANLTSSDLFEADLTQADLDGADLTNADLYQSNLNGSTLVGADLTDALLRYASIADVDFTDANLENADLGLTNLSQSILAGTDLTGTSLDGVSSGFITGTPSALPSGWSLVSGYLVGPQANLRDASLVDAGLAGADLFEADMTSADLTGANLTGANLDDANLTNVTWSNTACPDGTNSDADGDTCVNDLG